MRRSGAAARCCNHCCNCRPLPLADPAAASHRPTLAAITRPPSQGGALTPEEAASFGAVATLSAALGSLAGGPLADRYGRKRALALAMLPCAVGYVVIASGYGYYPLIFGRLLTGLSAGAVSVATPLYLSEIAPAHLRGSLGSTMQLAIVSGLLAVYLIGYEVVPTHGWRYLAGLGAVAPVLFAALLAPLLPESPTWLA